MTTRRQPFIALLAGTLCFFALLVPAQSPPPAAAKPNFSGRWKMVKEKSDFRGFKEPDMIVRVVDHHDPMLNLHTIVTRGGQTTLADISYFTDGSLTSNIVSGRDAQCKGFWDGPDLIIRTKLLTAKGEHELVEDRWQLSKDGQTLTTSSHIVTESGEADLVLVCSKEKPKP